MASLNNRPFADGYVIQTEAAPPARRPWQETFNSDAALYGGQNVGNFGAAIPSEGGRIEVRIPANGLLVFQRR